MKQIYFFLALAEMATDVAWTDPGWGELGNCDRPSFSAYPALPYPNRSLPVHTAIT